MKQLLILLAWLPMIALAAELPNAINSVQDLQACIKESTSDCINAACIENSPTNCIGQCKINAEIKCNELKQQL